MFYLSPLGLATMSYRLLVVRMVQFVTPVVQRDSLGIPFSKSVHYFFVILYRELSSHVQYELNVSIAGRVFEELC